MPRPPAMANPSFPSFRSAASRPSVVGCSQSVVGFMRLSRCANVGREEGGRLRSNNAIRNAMDGAADGEAEEDGHRSTAALSFLLCRLASLIHPVSSSLSLSEPRSAVVPASRGISLEPDSGILEEKGTEGKGE